MTWYAFPEGVRRRPAPHFRLVSVTGRYVSLADYRGRSNLVLFFAHGMDCAACRSTLAAFVTHAAEYGAQTAEVLVISPVTTDEAPAPFDTGFPVLSDPAGEVRHAYAALVPNGAVDDVLLFVLDRYGAPYAATACPEADDPAIHREALGWLAFIEMECPE
jgi:peroxiredoxin